MRLFEVTWRKGPYRSGRRGAGGDDGGVHTPLVFHSLREGEGGLPPFLEGLPLFAAGPLGVSGGGTHTGAAPAGLLGLMSGAQGGSGHPPGNPEPGIQPAGNKGAGGVTAPYPGEDDVRVLGNALALAARPALFLVEFVRARQECGPSRLLHVPAIAAPSNAALLAYLGADSLDTFRALSEARLGYMLDGSGRRLVRDDFGDMDRGGSGMGRPTMRPDAPTDAGRRALAALARDPPRCFCSACAGKSVVGMGFEPLARHNVVALLAELENVRAAASSGMGHLRSLVEARAAADPWSNRVLRLADSAQAGYLERFSPTGGEAVYPCVSTLSINRPSVRRFRDRLADPGRYVPPPHRPILLLLPCSERKPYGTSPSHRRFREALAALDPALRRAIHQVVVTSPLGAVPRELEAFFPAAHYDMPVAGRYDASEREMMKESLRVLLMRGGYTHVVCQLSTEAGFLREVLEDRDIPVEYPLEAAAAEGEDSGEGEGGDDGGTDTDTEPETESDTETESESDTETESESDTEPETESDTETETETDYPLTGARNLPGPSSAAGLRAMRSALKGIPAESYAGRRGPSGPVWDAAALMRFQFGPAGAAFFDGGDLDVSGPWGRKVVSAGGTQLAVIDSARGMASLSLAGGERLLSVWNALKEGAVKDGGASVPPAYVVRIQDFTPKGNLFAVGVSGACPAIRPGDEVVIVHGGEVRGVGRAVMDGRTMAESDRGLAVDVRHRRK